MAKDIEIGCNAPATCVQRKPKRIRQGDRRRGELAQSRSPSRFRARFLARKREPATRLFESVNQLPLALRDGSFHTDRAARTIRLVERRPLLLRRAIYLLDSVGREFNRFDLRGARCRPLGCCGRQGHVGHPYPKPFRFKSIRPILASLPFASNAGFVLEINCQFLAAGSDL